MRCLPAWLAAALLLPGALPAQRSLRPADVTVTLEIAKSFFADDEPIPVDVYVTNDTGEDLKADVFYPASSSVGLPDFHFIDALTGLRTSVPAGLYSWDWDEWYQPEDPMDSWRRGHLLIAAGERIHLLHGDLRHLVAGTREAYSARPEESREGDPEEIRRHRQMFELADRFVAGGVFVVWVQAYGVSNRVQINTGDPALSDEIDEGLAQEIAEFEDQAVRKLYAEEPDENQLSIELEELVWDSVLERGEIQPVEIEGAVIPPEAVFAPQPEYTGLARHLEIEGTVVLDAIVDRSGEVVAVRARQRLPRGLTREAIQAAQRWRFRPARLDGEPVAVFTTLSFDFRLGAPPEVN